MLRDPQLLMLWLRLGDESVNASIDGAAFRVGAGVQAD
nr:autotransporter outer membrane beta-barrel domain-containing protein [Escherichia coli]EKE8712872.1 autotransporter outer membrane beta-barrel domain-containing protein [Escherichia coli]